MKKLGTFLLAMCMALLAPVSALAQTTALWVTMGINLNLNGVNVQPVDASGSPVQLFIYQETTYVPIRFISESFGLAVDWDPASGTVLLKGSPDLGIPSVSENPVQRPVTQAEIQAQPGVKLNLNGRLVQPTDASGRAVEVYLWGSTTYVPIRFISEFYGLNVNWNDATHSVEIESTDSPSQQASENKVFQKYLVNSDTWSVVGAFSPSVDYSKMLSGVRFYSNGEADVIVGVKNPRTLKATYQIKNARSEMPQTPPGGYGDPAYGLMKADIILSGFDYEGVQINNVTVPAVLTIGTSIADIYWHDTNALRLDYSGTPLETFGNPYSNSTFSALYAPFNGMMNDSSN